MVISQRNGTSSITPTVDPTYNVDRWYTRNTAASKISVQQNAGSVTPPAGFTTYLGVTSLSAYSVGSTDFFAIEQRIEGFNAADLNWGTANAQTVTFSFWVRSSLTGVFGGCLRNGASNYNYPFSYSISTANTWEYKTVTIVGATAGSWDTSNGIGIICGFNIGIGSSYAGTANTWNSGSIYGPTGATSIVGTNGATFYITGVQLEVGVTATSFDYRPYGTELALAQRYCVVYGGSSVFEPFGYGFATSTTAVAAILALPVPMRIVPSFSASGSAQISDGGTGFTIFVLSLSSGAAGTQQVTLNATSSGLTQFRPYRIEATNNTTVRLIFSAEL
jgi:hypothetical protein